MNKDLKYIHFLEKIIDNRKIGLICLTKKWLIFPIFKIFWFLGFKIMIWVRTNCSCTSNLKCVRQAQYSKLTIQQLSYFY